MNLVTIAWKSIRERSLASALTSLSVGLSIMLIVCVVVMHGIINRTFRENSSGYNLVIGAKGSPLQLVLNTIYHIGDPVENIPYLFFKDLQKNSRVETAIPICMGDVTQEGNFRVIGTTQDYFNVDYLPERKFRVRGHFFENPFDAVIGAQVARTNKWDIGSTFKPAHGVADSDHVHDEVFTIVGILAPTGTPADNGVYVPIEGFYQIAGHSKPSDEAAAKAKAYATFRVESGLADAPGEDAHAGHDHSEHAHDDHAGHDHAGHDHAGHHHDIPDEQKEVTAVLVNFPEGMQIPGIMLQSSINEGPFAQAVIPFKETNWLMNNVVGHVRTLLLVLTILILIVSAVGVFVSIYNSMADRRREIAIMRAMGAQRSTILFIILTESILLCAGGAVMGMLAAHLLIVVGAPYFETTTGMIVNPWAVEPLEFMLVPPLVILASLIGFVPGITAYRTDVAKALHS